MNQNDLGSTDANTSLSMGLGGVVSITAETKVVEGPISGFVVVSGTVTVSGAKTSVDPRAQDVTAVAFGAGTFVLSLKDVTFIAAAGTTLAYLA